MSTAVAVPQQATTGTEPVRKVHLTRTFNAPRERVYAAWADPEQVRQWMGPTGFTCFVSEADVRVGGGYRLSMRGPHVAMGQEAPQDRVSSAVGEYLQVQPPELLQFTWRPDWCLEEESVVTVRLYAEEAGTRLELTHEGFATEQSEAGHGVGWNGSMEKLAAFLGR